MRFARDPRLLVLASVLFLVGSLSFLDDGLYTFGAWMFVLGSISFLSHSIATVRSGDDPD